MIGVKRHDDALKIFERYGIKAFSQALSLLGYKVKWCRLDPENAEILKMRAGFGLILVDGACSDIREAGCTSTRALSSIMASHIPNAFALFLVFCLAASASFLLVLAIKEAANDRIFLMKDLAGKA